jgi:DNA-binding CsgD family transcriptional regulator
MNTHEGTRDALQRPVHVPTFFLIASGFASISFWTDLVGHSPALLSSAAPVAIIGLTAIGTGFLWFSIPLLVRLVKEARHSVVVGAILVALLFKAALVTFVGLLAPANALAFSAVMLPLLAAAMLIGAQRRRNALGSPDALTDADGTPGDPPPDTSPGTPHDTPPLELLARSNSLSPRETEVFLLLAQGRNRPYIQRELFLSDGTVKTHISRIYHKLGVTNRQELITMVQKEQGLHQAADEPQRSVQ